MGIGGGISFSLNGVLSALSNLTTTVVGSAVNTLESLVGPYRPSQWAKPPVTSITVPATSTTSKSSLGQNGSGIGSSGFTFVTGTAEKTTTTPAIVYVFDAVFSLEHVQEMQITEHPVQTGANIADHAYIKPARVTMDVGMSDVMDSYVAGQWSGASSKSVNAYQILLQLELQRIPLIITTRLNTYQNMLVKVNRAKDTNETANGLRVTFEFQQLFMAQTGNSSSSSSRPQDTGSTQEGNVPTLVTPGVIDNNYLVLPPGPASPVVNGAGTFSSNPVGGLGI